MSVVYRPIAFPQPPQLKRPNLAALLYVPPVVSSPSASPRPRAEYFRAAPQQPQLPMRWNAALDDTVTIVCGDSVQPVGAFYRERPQYQQPVYDYAPLMPVVLPPPPPPPVRLFADGAAYRRPDGRGPEFVQRFYTPGIPYVAPPIGVLTITAVRTLTARLGQSTLLASTTSSTTATVSWTAPTPTGQSVIAGYSLYRGTAPAGPWTLVTTTTLLTFDDTFTYAPSYYYYVEAFDQYMTGIPSAPILISPPAVGSIKFHPGHGMASFNVNGTGASNNSEMTTLRNSGANVKHYLANYTWNAITATRGNYANNSTTNFGNIIADFNSLQSIAPGTRFTVLIGTRTFFSTGKAASQTLTGQGIPAYILANPGTYGPGTNGIQGGYSLGTFQAGPPSGSGDGLYHEAASAVWRAAVTNELISMYQTLADTPLGAYTFDTHPLVEAIFINDESAIDLNNTSGTGYSDSALRTQYQRLNLAAVAAFPHTNIVSGLNFVGTQANMEGFVADAYNARVAMGGPDIYISPHATWAQAVFAGGSWNGTSFAGAGTVYKGKMPYYGSVQSPDYGKYGATVTQIAQAGIANGVNVIYWTNTGTAFWNASVLPVINAVPITNTACPTSYGGACFGG